MRENNQRKAGVVLSYAGQAVQILSGLIYTPIMIRILGQSEYGLYQLVYSIVSYLSLLSLGFNASYMRFYSREKVKDSENGIEKLNGMFMLIFLAMSFICVICGIVMIANIKSIFGTGFTDYEYRKATILMALMVLNLALTFPNSVFTCIVTSQEKFVFQKALIFLQALLNPFLALPLLLMGYGSIGMVSVSTILTVIVLITNAYYCFRKLHSGFIFKDLQFALLKEMWAFTFFIFLNQIIDQINWSVDKFLLGRFSGTIAVAVYSVGGQINSMYLQFSTSVSNVFVPQVNKIVAESDDDKELSRIFIKVGRVQFMIMMLILTGLVFFGKPFIKWWAGDGYDDSYFVTLLLTIPVTIPLIQNIGIEIQRARNKHKARSIVYFFIAIANIFVSIPLIRLLGPVGAAIGTAISLLLGNGIFMNWYYYRKLNINIPAFWKSLLQFLPAILISSIFGICSMCFIEYRSFVVLAFGIIAYCMIYSLAIYFTGMNQDEKKIVREVIEKVSNHIGKRTGKV